MIGAGIALTLLFGLLTLVSYVDRLYQEIGKFLSRDFQDNIDSFERLVEQSLTAPGPTLIGVRIDDKPGVGATRRDPVQIRERFMLGLGVRQAF